MRLIMIAARLSGTLGAGKTTILARLGLLSLLPISSECGQPLLKAVGIQPGQYSISKL